MRRTFLELPIGTHFKYSPTSTTIDVKIERQDCPSVKRGYLNAQCVDTGLRSCVADDKVVSVVSQDQ